MRTCVESQRSCSKLMCGNYSFMNGISVLRKVKMKLLKTWVLIGDGARARILEIRGPGEGLPFAADHSRCWVWSKPGSDAASIQVDRAARRSRCGPARAGI